MSTITIPNKLWHRLADVIQDMGNHYPAYKNTSAGADLNTLGNAIKYGVPPYPGASDTSDLKPAMEVIAKHGGGRAGLTVIEQAIETAEKLLGLWVEA